MRPRRSTDLNGTAYAFENMTNQVLTLNLTTGGTTVFSGYDPATGLIEGAASPTPEPAPLVFTGFGLSGIVDFDRAKIPTGLQERTGWLAVNSTAHRTPPLLSTESDHGIDSRCAARREVSRQ